MFCALGPRDDKLLFHIVRYCEGKGKCPAPEASWSIWVTRLLVTRQADLEGPRTKAIKAGIRTMATSVGFTVLLFLVYFTFGITCLSSQRTEEKHTQREVVCNILRLSCVGSFSSVHEIYFQVMKTYGRDFNLRWIICEYYLSYTLSVNSNNNY